MSLWRRSAIHLISLLPISFVKAVSAAQWKHPLLRRLFAKFSSALRSGGGSIQSGAGRGLVFLADNGVAGYLLGTYEIGTQQALSHLLKPGDVVFDIGANCGFVTIIAAKLVGPSGKVIAFEPFPEAAVQVERNVTANNFQNVEIQRVALGSEDGDAQFYTSCESGWGRLQSAGGTLAEALSEISVAEKRLDSIASQLPRPNLIKVDIEGGEVGMLRGAMQTISDAQPILLIELHGTNDPVAQILNELKYSYRVLGSGSSDLSSAPWYAYVLAGPARVEPLISQVCSSVKDIR